MSQIVCVPLGQVRLTCRIRMVRCGGGNRRFRRVHVHRIGILAQWAFIDFDGVVNQFELELSAQPREGIWGAEEELGPVPMVFIQRIVEDFVEITAFVEHAAAVDV